VTVHLRDASGMPASTFGTGTPFSNSQAEVNAASFGQQTLFGKQFGGPSTTTSPTPVTPTKAGSTKNMYDDPTKSARGVHAAPMQPRPPSTQPPQLTASEDWDTNGPTGQIAGAAKEVAGRYLGPNDEEGEIARATLDMQSARNGNFFGAAASSRPAHDIPGLAEDVAEDA